MKSNLNKSLVVAAISSLFAASAVHATNGYFSDGTGAKSRGMGGAGVAIAQETGSIVTNPATAVNMGERLDIGMGLFSPSARGYTISGNDCSNQILPGPTVGSCGGGSLDGTQESRKTGFLIPFIGQSFEIDSESSMALTMSALGGMNTDYKNNPFAPFGATGPMGIDLKQVNIGMTYARKINNQLSVGVTGSLIIQEFEAKGLGAFAQISTDTTGATLTNAGKSRSTGIGIKLGLTYEVNNDVTIGFVYAPEVDMSEFDEYAGLFAEKGDFDIPSNYTLGVAWKATSDITVGADYSIINYSDVPSIANASGVATSSCGFARFMGQVNPSVGVAPDAASESTCLGGANGAGFGWDDISVIKIGVAWDQSSDMTYRIGLNHGENPIEAEDTTFNVLAPGVVEDHLTLGLTRKLSSTSEISVNYIRTFANDVTGAIPDSFGRLDTTGFGTGGAVPVGPIPGSGGSVNIEMEQNFIEVQYGKRY